MDKSLIQQLSPYRHIIESQQFDEEFLSELFKTARFMSKNERNVGNLLKGMIVTMLFYQPSTRTRLSFEAAALRLGASTITTENAKEFSSAAKGETLEDTIKIASGYCNFIVLRHFDDDSAERAYPYSNVPLINAGSGQGQHPTQALTDVFTIFEQFEKLNGLNIAVAGDLLRGRTVNSLVYLLSKFPGNKFYFVAPENSKIKVGMKDHLSKHGYEYYETDCLEKVLPEVDVLYMTRVQREWFKDIGEYEKAKGKVILNGRNVELMRKDAIVMHPLPRTDEIAVEVDLNPRARYFKQAKENALHTRMALLKMLYDHNYVQNS